MIDTEAIDLYAAILTKSRRGNIGPREAMVAMGVLLTESRRREIVVDAVDRLAADLRLESPQAILAWHRGASGVPASAADMFDAVCAWADDYARLRRDHG